jgi:hypothetical protein
MYMRGSDGKKLFQGRNMTMRSIKTKLTITALAMLAGCLTPQYGREQQVTLQNRIRPVWAIAPAINLSGQPQVDPLLQSDLLYQQLQEVNNITVIPVDRVIQVYAALRIEKVQSEDQAAVVCEQLGCDALLIPTVTTFDPYDPPKMGAAIQLLARPGSSHAPNVDAHELTRLATPLETQALPPRPNFIQVVGMYDAANGTVHEAVLTYAKGRNDPVGPLGAKEYFVNMDRFSGFVYHALILDLLHESAVRSGEPLPSITAASEVSPLRARLTIPRG